MAFKIALNAGHYMGQPGKRCLKSIDKNETREWWLNNRICDKVEQGLTAYQGYWLLRIDDTTGKQNLTLTERTNKANAFGADIYIAVHHNAGIGGGSGGGTQVYTYTKVGDTTKQIQRLIYDKLIAKTGLKGNRATPLATANFAECRQTKMPAVLIENGFMDSKTDTPIILTEEFANKSAAAIVEAIVELGGLMKKSVSATAPPAPKPVTTTPITSKNPTETAKPITTTQPKPPTETVSKPAPTTQICTGTVKKGKHPYVRATPSLLGKKLGTLAPFQTVTVLAKTGLWYKIQYGTTTAYTATKYMEVKGTIPK